MSELEPIQDLHFVYVIEDEGDGSLRLLKRTGDLQDRLEFIVDCEHVGLFITRMTA